MVDQITFSGESLNVLLASVVGDNFLMGTSGVCRSSQCHLLLLHLVLDCGAFIRCLVTGLETSLLPLFCGQLGAWSCGKFSTVSLSSSSASKVDRRLHAQLLKSVISIIIGIFHF